jgi:uncharacterized protein YbjQ (UPF0145 family)
MTTIRWECPGCNRAFKVSATKVPDLCPDCIQSSVAAMLDAEEPEPETEVEDVPASQRIIRRTLMFTTPTAPGYNVLRVFPAVFATRAFGMGFFADLAVAFRDAAGGRSGTLEGNFATMREQLLDELRHQAKALGANGILSLHVEFGEISGKGQMVFANASGTPALLKPV